MAQNYPESITRTEENGTGVLRYTRLVYGNGRRLLHGLVRLNNLISIENPKPI
jgi:hypothetical protein